ncbi:MAG: hypothetical protein ACFE0P_07525 [Oceanicaulis sp.]
MTHYAGLVAGYGAAIAVFWIAWFCAPNLKRWLGGVRKPAARPWLEFALLLAAAAGVVAMGQLYVADLLAPDRGEVLQSLNQLIIFSPLIAVLIWRGAPALIAGLPIRGAPAGLALGVGLAGTALAAYGLARGWTSLDPAATIFTADNLSYGVQVLLQDVAIAALLARLADAAGWRIALVAVAILFQLAHIPPFLAGGAELADLASLVIDTGIGLAVFGAVVASRSIWWFWPLHTVMDLAQFTRAAPG